MIEQLTIEEFKGSNVGINNGTITNIFDNQKKDSNLRRFLNLLLNSNSIKDEPKVPSLPFKIEDKIDKNNVCDDWLEIIENEYFKYEDAISNILNADNENGIANKSIFLDTMSEYYRNVKKSLNLYGASIENIAENSSVILDETVNLYVDFLKSKGEDTEESDKYLVKILVVYGFMECKVLEKPMVI